MRTDVELTLVIERDMVPLMEGLPLTWEWHSRQKRYRFMEGYRFSALSLNLSEGLALILAQDAASHFYGTPHFQALTQAIDKISAFLPLELGMFQIPPKIC